MVLNKTEILALDVGDVRLGVARCNRIARLPEPLQIIDVTDTDALTAILDERAPSLVLVGMPRNMSGKLTPQSAKIRDWAENVLRPLLPEGMEMEYVDETLSSVAARGRAPGAKHIDDIAAAEILEIYLRSNQEDHYV